jgi:hypothetical protein
VQRSLRSARPTSGPANEIEAKPVALDAGGATLKRLDAAANPERTLIHVGAIGEIPNLVGWQAGQTSAPVTVVAAREKPRLRDKPAQLKPEIAMLPSSRRA